MNNMKIKDLKKAIANLPDDMDVIIPVYEGDYEDCPRGHRLVRLAGVVENCVNERAFVLQTAQNDSITLKDTLSIADAICIEELYPNHYQQLITLRDYKNAGVFKTMPNGFEIYDIDLEDEDGTALLLTHPLFGCTTYLDCRVFGISSEDFIKLVKSESKLKDSYTNEFLKVMGYKAITSDDNNIYKTKIEKIR